MVSKTKSHKIITTLPLTAEAREKLLTEIFRDSLPNINDIFVPGNSFYIHSGTHEQAKHMLVSICEWLGIKPGYIGLEFELDKSLDVVGSKYNIFIESNIIKNELLLGAYIARALTRYLIEERKQIHLEDASEQMSLVATGTIVFGLGLVVANGLVKTKNKTNQTLIGTIPILEYISMIKGYLWNHSIPEHIYENSITPFMSKLLGLPKPKNPISIIKQKYHTDQQLRYEKFGLAWVIVMGIVLSIFINYQRVVPDSEQVKSLQDQIVLLKDLSKDCKESVRYKKQYTDPSDFLSVRNINSEALRCTSIDNQLLNSQNSLDKLE